MIKLLFILIAITFTAMPANASYITFTDRSAFLAATSSTTNITFEGLAPANGFTLFDSGLTQSGVTFTGSSNYLFVVDPGYEPFYYDWGSGQVLHNEPAGAIHVALPAGVYAVGSDISSILDYAAQFTVTLDDNSTFTFSSDNYPDRAFAGIISTSGFITSIDFAAGNAYTQLDNFVFATAAVAVPVPAGIVMSSIGVIGIGSFAWLRRRKTQVA